jgi:N-acetyl-alpha-D-glucosaminyl L-malate synthase BshA
VIYNFLNPDKFNGESISRCQLAEGDEKIIMHISNFRPVKRVTDVVRAFKKILDHVNARLIMVGEGPERMAAVGVAKQLGISDKIKYMGNYGDIESILPCADLVFQPSEHESFGLVPLEAMACAVPVLVTASGGITEIVEHGKTGFLCEVGDIEAMAKCATDLLSNPKLAKKMGAAGQQVALNRFKREDIVDQYESLYEEVMGIRKQNVAMSA